MIFCKCDLWDIESQLIYDFKNTEIVTRKITTFRIDWVVIPTEITSATSIKLWFKKSKKMHKPKSQLQHTNAKITKIILVPNCCETNHFWCVCVCVYKPKTNTMTHKTMLVNRNYMFDSIKTRNMVKTQQNDTTEPPNSSANDYIFFMFSFPIFCFYVTLFFKKINQKTNKPIYDCHFVRREK